MPHTPTAATRCQRQPEAGLLWAALTLTASAALSWTIAFAPVESPLPTVLPVVAPAAPVVIDPPALTLPGPLPPLRFTAAPARPSAAAAVNRRPHRHAPAQAEIIARLQAHGQALWHFKLGIGKALQAALQPVAAPAVAVAVPAEPADDPPAKPAPAEPPTTTESEPPDGAESDDAGSEEPIRDGGGADLEPAEPGEDDEQEELGDEPQEDDGDLRPVRGAKA